MNLSVFCARKLYGRYLYGKNRLLDGPSTVYSWRIYVQFEQDTVYNIDETGDGYDAMQWITVIVL